MPRQEIYTTLDGTRSFEGRVAYLDYMRERYKERVKMAKLGRRRALARERLQGVHQCMTVEEIEEFLNRHLGDISILSDSFESEKLTKIKIEMEDGDRECVIQYTNHPRNRSYKNWESFCDLPQERARVWTGMIYWETMPGTKTAQQVQQKAWNRHADYDIPRLFSSKGISDVLKSIGIHTGSGGGTTTGAGKNGRGSMRLDVRMWRTDFPMMHVMERLAA
jgi:hypothetical protein